MSLSACISGRARGFHAPNPPQFSLSAPFPLLLFLPGGCSGFQLRRVGGFLLQKRQLVLGKVGVLWGGGPGGGFGLGCAFGLSCSFGPDCSFSLGTSFSPVCAFAPGSVFSLGTSFDTVCAFAPGYR